MTYLGSVRSPRVVNIADLRRLAKRRLPRLVFDYIDGGAEDEITLRDNVPRVREIRFRPRQCVAVPACDLRTTVLGTTFDAAVPARARRLLPHVLSARRSGARRGRRSAAGTAYILSTFSGTGSRTSARRTAAALVSALRARRPRGRGSQPWRARERPATRCSSSRSTRRSPACVSATSATALGPLLAADWREPAAPLAVRRASALGARLPRGRRTAGVPERRAARRRADAVQRRRRAARADDRHLGRPSVDSRRVERPGRRQGRAHRRRCAACDRRRRRCDRRLEPRRAAARRRAGEACARCRRCSRPSTGASR